MKLSFGKALTAFALLSAPAVAADLPARTPAAPVAPAFVAYSPWQVRVRALAVLPDEKITFNQNATFSAGVSNAYVPELDISYYFTPNIAVELILGVTEHKVRGTGPLQGLNIGNTWLLPPTLTLQYHFTNFGAFQPYVGAGVNYTWGFSNKAGNVVFGGPGAVAALLPGSSINAFSLKSAPGLALQIGFDYMLNANWGINVDVKKLWLRPDFTANLLTPPATNTFLSGKAQLDPWLIGVGVTYRFGATNAPVLAKY